MQVLGISNINGKPQNTNNMQPPRKALGEDEGLGAHSFKQWHERCAEEESAG